MAIKHTVASVPSVPPDHRGSWRSTVTLARLYAATRIALGGWIFVDPSGFGGKWFGEGQDPLVVSSILRSVGGRDLMIGVGMLVSKTPRPWLLLAACCDVLDAGIVFWARSRFTDGEVVMGVVGALSYAAVALGIAVVAGRSERRGVTA